MDNPQLATYLNDHLASSEVAFELLDLLEKEHAGTQIAILASGLREDIAADRRELEALMSRLGIAQGGVKQAARLRLRIDDPKGGGLRLLEIFEALSLDIEGKRLLWRSLKTAAVYNPELQGTDYQTLEHRAEDQRLGVEPFRMGAAKGTFAPGK
jgi:hypothetical protein